MKKRFGVIVAVLSLFLITGCGGSKGAKTTKESKESVEQTETKETTEETEEDKRESIIDESKYEIKDESAETILKEAGYTVKIGTPATDEYTAIVLENLEDRTVITGIINVYGQLLDIEYSNQEQGFKDRKVYYNGTYEHSFMSISSEDDMNAIESYVDKVRSLGMTLPTFVEFVQNFGMENNPEAAPKRFVGEIPVLKDKVGSAFQKNNYVFYTIPNDKYLFLDLTKREEGIRLKLTATEKGLYEINYTNLDESVIDNRLYYNAQHEGSDEALDAYLGTLKDLGITESDLEEFIIEYRKQVMALRAGGTAPAEDATTESSTPSAAEQNNDSTTADNSGVVAAIKRIDAKYDEMITKAQGYVDNPSTYNDTASLTFLTDYTKLMAEYAELGKEINDAGGTISDADGMTMYTNMLTKSATLAELYGKLGTQ
ncbi:hypothetical protein ACYSNR_06840 [Enterococcus sp. LJL128]